MNFNKYRTLGLRFKQFQMAHTTALPVHMLSIILTIRYQSSLLINCDWLKIFGIKHLPHLPELETKT